MFGRVLELLVEDFPLLLSVGEIKDGVGVAHNSVKLALGGFVLHKRLKKYKKLNRIQRETYLMSLPAKGGLRVLQERPDGHLVQVPLGAWGGSSSGQPSIATKPLRICNGF